MSIFAGRSATARRLLGLLLVGTVVVLWTASSFLTSALLVDDTYSKPYFITWFNTSMYTLVLIPTLVRYLLASSPQFQALSKRVPWMQKWHRIPDEDTPDPMARSIDALLPHHRQAAEEQGLEMQADTSLAIDDDNDDDDVQKTRDRLTFKETATLACQFGLASLGANWSSSACLRYTTVASATIISSTSSAFTLILGARLGVEKFTVKKLIGVIASLTGVVIIAMLDQQAEEDNPNRGDFPYKPPAEIALGDAIALAGAIIYGVYASIFTKVVGDESRVDMALFFGCIGTLCFFCFWPGLIIVHFLGVEPFELPPHGRLWFVLFINAVISLIADMSWAFAVLLTSPLVATVGISMTIPLSLVGQMVINGQFASIWYWFGGSIVILAFVFINHSSSSDEAEPSAQDEP